MGSGRSVLVDNNRHPSYDFYIQQKLTFNQLLEFVMPIYFTKLTLLPHCKAKLIHSWKLITTNKAEGFYKCKREDPDFTPCNSPMEFFANRITLRLIEVHPVCHSMFTKTTYKQGTLFMNMISFLVNEMDTPKFQSQLEMLANSHTKLGVRAAECKASLLLYLLSFPLF